jgi:hypothetical protein
VAVGVDADAVEAAFLVAGEGVELGDRLQLVAEEGQTPSAVLQVSGPDFEGVARTRKLPRAKAASLRRYCWAMRSARTLRCS